MLDTTFPHDKPQMLYWNVQSDFDGEATVEITYFTSGITWSADYVCIADKDEKQMSFEGFVRVTNNTGEEYENAQVRLVVGTINLVEKIAQLAHIPVAEVDKLERRNRGLAAQEAAKDDVRRPTPAGFGGGGACRRRGPRRSSRKGSANTSSTPSKAPKRSPTAGPSGCDRSKPAAVPFKIQYRYRPQEYGEQLVRMYLLTNDKDSKLGTTPLPDGTVRVFRDNGRDGLSYLAEPDDQVHPHRRQDRAESRRRPECDLRADQAQSLSRQHLDADQRR